MNNSKILEENKKEMLKKIKSMYISDLVDMVKYYTDHGGESGELFDYLQIPTSTIEDCVELLTKAIIMSYKDLTTSTIELKNLLEKIKK